MILDRIKNLQRYMDINDIDWTFLVPSPNFFYLTGVSIDTHERLTALLIPKDDIPTIIVPSFERERLEQDTEIANIVSWQDGENPYDYVKKITGSEIKTIAIEDNVPFGVLYNLDTKIKISQKVPITPYISELRLKKSTDEINFMKQAGRIIEKALEDGYQYVKENMSELDLAKYLEDRIVEYGGTPTFTIIQFGPNSAIPHAESSRKKLKKGEIILIDFGCSYKGYNTDQTRMAVLGKATEKHKEIYSIVQEAQEAAIKYDKEGVSAESVDKVARDVIESKGYGKYFIHRLGHGIGIEVHEPPYIVQGNKQILEEGMTHSIEPGIYILNEFGVRIEDLVEVKKNGVEIITFSKKELREI